MVNAADLARAERAELLGLVAGTFARREARTQAGKYVDGLLADLPRKNGWTLPEHAGDRSPDRMQRLLNQAVWDETAASAAVRDFVIGHLADDFAVAVFDEPAQEKKGNMTAGVKRQYAGCVGKVTNAINVVYCSTPPHAGMPSSAPPHTCRRSGSTTPTTVCGPASTRRSRSGPNRP